MSISLTLSNALTGLAASSRSAQVVSSNVSNSTTEGYARREIELSARGVGGAGSGVRVDGIVRVVDETLLRELRLSAAANDEAREETRFYQGALDALGEPQDPSSLTSRLAELDRSLLAATSRPESDARLNDVLHAMQGSHLHEQFEAERIGGTKWPDKQMVGPTLPENGKDLTVEGPELITPAPSGNDQAAQKSTVHSAAKDIQTPPVETPVATAFSSVKQVSIRRGSPATSEVSTRKPANVPGVPVVVNETHVEKVKPLRPDAGVNASRRPEGTIPQGEISFDDGVPIVTEGWTPGRSGLVAPPAQGAGADLAAFVSGGAPQPKGGIELSGLRENLIEKGDPIADGATLEFEETLKTKHVERARPEPASARSIVNQVIQSVTRAHADGVIEIRLQPEELGRIRLTMVAGEAGMTVQISVERADTLELVRRNIDMLENELLGQGFEDLSFSFNGEDRDAERERQENPEEIANTTEAIGSHGLSVVLANTQQPNTNGTLDIRV